MSYTDSYVANTRAEDQRARRHGCQYRGCEQETAAHTNGILEATYPREIHDQHVPAILT